MHSAIPGGRSREEQSFVHGGRFSFVITTVSLITSSHLSLLIRRFAAFEGTALGWVPRWAISSSFCCSLFDFFFVVSCRQDRVEWE
jgi:hypothetical protein